MEAESSFHGFTILFVNEYFQMSASNLLSFIIYAKIIAFYYGI